MCLAGGFTKPLIPRLMEGPDEEPNQRSSLRESKSDNQAGMRECQIRAVEEDLL